MSAWEALGVLASRWEPLARRLPPSAHRELAALLARIREETPGGPDAEELAERAVAAVLGALPEDEALGLRKETGPSRLAGSPGREAGGFDAGDLCMLVIDGNPMVGPVLGPVRERLLGAPALSEDEAARGGARPADRALLVLTDPRGQRRYPAFQFDPRGRPWEVVLRVNSLLGSAEDPWGTADWWLSEHVWWGRPPSELPGTGQDAALWAAGLDAAGLGEGD
ncbi:hypothetical protein [Streptomyces sp. NPDC047968]|uniref:hypothetical protein n=1 Tax=unclassified Streptomyces TaxID=2593676 RepID=UPI0034294005